MSIGRHPRDVARLAIAVAVITLCAFLSRDFQVNPVEVAIREELGTLPAAARPVWMVLLWCGSWPGAAVVSGAALYGRRIRLGLECAAGAAAAWGLAELTNWLVGGRAVPVFLSQAGWIEFPAWHVAIMAALATIVGPYLPGALRDFFWFLTVVVAAAEIALGGQLPLNVLAGAFAGWAVGTLFHLVLGAPGRRTSEDAVRHELERAGLAPATVSVIKRPLWWEPQQYRVVTADDHPLRVQVVRRMHRRAGIVYKLRRMLASLEVQDEPDLSTAHHEVDHEALVTLLAERAKVRTPPIVLACKVTHASPLLIHQEVPGRRLSELAAEEIGEDLLSALWSEIAKLGNARVAHHDLRAENILVDEAGRPWLLGFTFGRAGADPMRCRQDIAEALVSVGAMIGTERTIDSACRALPADHLEAALRYLHILALPRRIRAQARDSRNLIVTLRESLANRLACPLPVFRSPLRAGHVVGLLLMGLAVYLLLPQVSSMDLLLGSLRTANWWWLGITVLTGIVAIVFSAVSILGSSPTRLPVWRTIMVQIGAAFTGRTTPGGAGFFGINVAFMKRLGMPRAQAFGVTVLNLAGTGFVGFLVSVIGIFTVGLSGELGKISIPTGWPVLVAVAGVLIAAGLVFGSPLGRRRIVQPSLNSARDLLATLRHPVRALQLFGGALAYLVFSALGLATSIAAFGAHAPLLAVLTVFTVGQTLGHLAPIPGGLGAVETTTVAGLTAIGLEPTSAVAAVLTSRLLTYWLPALPGVAAFRYLQHKEMI
jgi:undecaprenyl-diphosphatase